MNNITLARKHILLNIAYRNYAIYKCEAATTEKEYDSWAELAHMTSVGIVNWQKYLIVEEKSNDRSMA